jgi:hypothetical protein
LWLITSDLSPSELILSRPDAPSQELLEQLMRGTLRAANTTAPSWGHKITGSKPRMQRHAATISIMFIASRNVSIKKAMEDHGTRRSGAWHCCC